MQKYWLSAITHKMFYLQRMFSQYRTARILLAQCLLQSCPCPCWYWWFCKSCQGAELSLDQWISNIYVYFKRWCAARSFETLGRSAIDARNVTYIPSLPRLAVLCNFPATECRQPKWKVYPSSETVKRHIVTCANCTGLSHPSETLCVAALGPRSAAEWNVKTQLSEHL